MNSHVKHRFTTATIGYILFGGAAIVIMWLSDNDEQETPRENITAPARYEKIVSVPPANVDMPIVGAPVQDHDEPLVSPDVKPLSQTGLASVVRKSPAERASDVNQEMDRDLSSPILSADYAERMEAVFRDAGEEETIRNFAVQHLERYAQERAIRGEWDADADEAEKLRNALWDAAGEVGNSVGGTALLALSRLSEIDPRVDRAALGARARSLLSRSDLPDSTRIAAAQLCGLLRVKSARRLLSSLSSDSSVPTPLRLSAAHSLSLLDAPAPTE